ncbi:MAG: Glu/Leu/Phe/Val dehydrogenase, partial [bacterium]
MPAGSKESLLRAFARAIRHETYYLVGPDLGTDDICMGWILDEFGRAVGRHAARFLVERGAVVVAVADSHGALVNPGGLDVAALEREKADGGAVSDHAGGMACPRDALLDVDGDIWIPAARPDAIREADVPRLRAKMVLPGANIPMSAGAERALAARGVLVVPDFIANA